MVKIKIYYVYIIECQNGDLYTGVTTDIKRRLKQHNGELKGGAKFTKGKSPVVLKYKIEAENRSEAQKIEYQIKKMDKLKKIDLIRNFLST